MKNNYSDLVQQSVFINKMLNAEIKNVEVNEDSETTFFTLKDGSTVSISDEVRCIHNYVVNGNTQEADMSVELRDFIIDLLENHGRDKEKLNYCRKCLTVITDEEIELRNKLLSPLSKADRQAYYEQKELIQEQVIRVTDIINTPIREDECEMQ